MYVGKVSKAHLIRTKIKMVMDKHTIAKKYDENYKFKEGRY